MLFHHENLQEVKTFINVYHKKKQNFLNIFPDFPIHQGACELGIKRALLERLSHQRKYCMFVTNTLIDYNGR